MRRLLPLALVVLSACGGGATSPTNPGATTNAAQTIGPGATTNATPTAGTSVVIPAACAAGFIEYLKGIEPVVSGFHSASAAFGDFFSVDEAASEKGVEIMMANGAAATYSCPEVGLEFAYFDTRSPWSAIHEIAAANAPGTIAYLQIKELVSAIDTAELSDYGVVSCDDAVARIKKGVADETGAGTESAEDMDVDAGLALLGLYRAYLADVRDGACPADALGNDEFDFFGAIG